MTTPTLTLTRGEYEERCADLEQRQAEKQRAYELAALRQATGQGDEKLAYDLRGDVVALELERQQLDAAWRAAERERARGVIQNGRQRQKEAYEKASGHLENAARLVGEIESLALKMADLVEEAVNEDQAARRAVSRNVNRRGAHDPMDATPMRLTLQEHELEELFNTIRSRFLGKREHDIELAAKASGRASARREKFAAMLGQDFNDDNEQEAA
jgi:hypothetical protein